MSHPPDAATVAGRGVSVADVDAREALLRDAVPAASLPRAGTSEGRQLRRWLTQLMVTERLIAAEAAAVGLAADSAPAEDELMPDVSARLEIGSVAAAALADPLARAMFVHVTGGVQVADADVTDYHVRNPLRFAEPSDAGNGWRTATVDTPSLDSVRSLIVEHLRGAARRRAFRLWLDARRAELVRLAPGYEHPGDPRQPDNTHRH
jgi:[acyl-carrier-protein] S-malonyltransferase